MRQSVNQSVSELGIRPAPVAQVGRDGQPLSAAEAENVGVAAASKAREAGCALQLLQLITQQQGDLLRCALANPTQPPQPSGAAAWVAPAPHQG
jgi:hypothetical protein